MEQQSKDWLGGTNGFLFSQQLYDVDRPLYTAAELVMADQSLNLSPYVSNMLSMARATENLVAKRYAWMLICTIRPEMQSFLLGNCPYKKIKPWLAALPVELDKFLDGCGQEGSTDPITQPSDLKYPTLEIFVTELIALYHQL